MLFMSAEMRKDDECRISRSEATGFNSQVVAGEKYRAAFKPACRFKVTVELIMEISICRGNTRSGICI